MQTKGLVEPVAGKPDWSHYTLRNKNGMSVSFLNIGGAITALIPPDGEETVLRYENLHDYEENTLYLGALIGPVAGRIKEGTYTYEGKRYVLSKNEGHHHLHGGEAGFHNRLWEVEMKNESCAELTTVCNEDGYPGKVTVTVTYNLSEENEFSIDYYAEVSHSRPVALTNHTYFNLGDEDVSRHLLTMDADSFLELDDELISTGGTRKAEGSFDFSSGRPLEGTYDHYFLLNDCSFTLSFGDRNMKVWTDQEGVQLFTGSNISGEMALYNRESRPFSGVCLETQNHPVSLAYDGFPSIIVTPEKPYQKRTVFSFPS